MDGLFSVNPITLDLTTLLQNFNLEVPFGGQVEMTHWSTYIPGPQPPVLLNDYIFNGSGVAHLYFYSDSSGSVALAAPCTPSLQNLQRAPFACS